MENEILEKNISQNSQNPLESEENASLHPEDVLFSETILEDEAGASASVPESETNEVSDVLESGEVKNEDIYNSVSDNAMSFLDGYGGSSSAVTNYYSLEMPAEEVVPLWEKQISDFSTTEMLLFLIFLLLLVRFVHDIFKGSHFLKG